MSAMKLPFDQWELGVEAFIGKGPGLGYRELDGRLWFGPIGRSVGHLMPDQMLTVISALAYPCQVGNQLFLQIGLPVHAVR